MKLKDVFGDGHPKINFRIKFIEDNLRLLRDNKEQLDIWEVGFLKNTENHYEMFKDLTSRHYNKLKEIAEKFK